MADDAPPVTFGVKVTPMPHEVDVCPICRNLRAFVARFGTGAVPPPKSCGTYGWCRAAARRKARE